MTVKGKEAWNMSPYIDVVIFLLVMVFTLLGLVPFLVGPEEPSEPGDTEYAKHRSS